MIYLLKYKLKLEDKFFGVSTLQVYYKEVEAKNKIEAIKQVSKKKNYKGIEAIYLKLN